MAELETNKKQANHKPKMKSKEYPAVTFVKSLDFVEKFKDFGNKPISYDVAAKICNVSPTTKSFAYSISAARQFGLVASSGKTITLTDAANRLLRPTEDAHILSELKAQCFASPTLYKALVKDSDGKALPELTSLENILVSYHGIAPSVAKSAAQTFLTSANEVGVVVHGVLNMEAVKEKSEDKPTGTEDNETGSDAILEADDMGFPGTENSEEFGAPLTVSFGDKRRAILYMPIDATKEDAEYVQAMIDLMFKRVYKVGADETN